MFIRWINQFANPDRTYGLCNLLLPWFVGFAVVALPLGMVWGLVFAPTDYQQFDVYRIIYIHVPTATLSLSAYVAMAVAAFVGLVWQWRTAFTAMIAIAPVGAVITFISLLTGAVWGKPTWGTYWIWDARLTSQLILLFLYMGVFALYVSFEDKLQGGKAAAVMAVVGIINIPIIKYSVEWWNTLHQPATISKLDKPSMPPEMLVPLLITMVGMAGFIGACVLLRLRNELIKRDAHRPWVHEFMNQDDHKLKQIPRKNLATVLFSIMAVMVAYSMYQQGVKFESAADFVDMGGRGVFVWMSFGGGIIAMMLLLSHSILMNKMAVMAVKKQHHRAQRIMAARAAAKAGKSSTILGEIEGNNES